VQETAFPISPAEANFGLKGSNFYLSRNLPTVVEAVTEVDTLPSNNPVPRTMKVSNGVVGVGQKKIAPESCAAFPARMLHCAGDLIWTVAGNSGHDTTELMASFDHFQPILASHPSEAAGASAAFDGAVACVATVSAFGFNSNTQVVPA